MSNFHEMMFLIPKNADEVEVVVIPRTFNIIEEASLFHFDEPLADLDYDKAAGLIGGVYVSIAKAQDSRATLNGGYVIDSELDGKEAVVGHAQVTADELRPRIDDERVLVLNVLGSRNVWHTIVGRSTKIEQSLRFSNYSAE